MRSINDFLFRLIHQGAGYYPALDRFFVILTTWGTMVVLGIVLAYWCAIRPFRTTDPKERLSRIGSAIEAAISVFTTWFVVMALKVIIAHPRPFVVFADLTPLVSAAPYESFPSAHAALTLSVAMTIYYHRKHIGHMLIAFSLVIALSRLFVGVHYPVDILGGLLIGYLVPAFIHRAFRSRAA